MGKKLIQFHYALKASLSGPMTQHPSCTGVQVILHVLLCTGVQVGVIDTCMYRYDHVCIGVLSYISSIFKILSELSQILSEPIENTSVTV